MNVNCTIRHGCNHVAPEVKVQNSVEKIEIHWQKPAAREEGNGLRKIGDRRTIADDPCPYK